MELIYESDGQSEVIRFDVTESEGHEGTSTPTEYPVENQVRADHVRANPRKLTGIVWTSNNHLTLGDPGTTVTRTEDMHALLERLRIAGMEFSAITSLGQLDHMVITRVGAKRVAATAGGIGFDLELSEIQVANSQTVDAPIPVEPRGRPPVNRGAQGTADPATTTQPSGDSAALVLWESLTG